MRADTLEILRCPYCGGRLEVATSQFHTRAGDDLVDGILGCHCCAFPVVAGIPGLPPQPAAAQTPGHLDAGRPDPAPRSTFELADHPHSAERISQPAQTPSATIREN